MGQKVFFVNKETKRKYEVVENNIDTTGELIMRGMETGVSFPMKFNKQQFKDLGYTLVKEEVDDDEEEYAED